MRARPLYDIVALLARIGIGTVFIAHGWQKVQVGITQTSDQFTSWDVPFPTAAAVYATFVELLGGAALILGLALPIAGVLLFIDMAGAAVFVNGTNGIFLVDEHGVARNGFELALVLGLAGLVFAVPGGAGRVTLDHRLFGRRRAETSAPESESAFWPDEPADWPDGRPAIGSRAESSTSPSRSSSSSSSSSRSSSRSSSSPASSSSRSRPGASPAALGTTRSGPPETPETPESSASPAKPSSQAKSAKPPAMPATTGGPTVAESAASPRLAADIVTGTSGDTLVAGRKKRRSGGKKAQGDATQPISKRRGAGKTDPAD